SALRSSHPDSSASTPTSDETRNTRCCVFAPPSQAMVKIAAKITIGSSTRRAPKRGSLNRRMLNQTTEKPATTRALGAIAMIGDGGVERRATTSQPSPHSAMPTDQPLNPRIVGWLDQNE